MTTPNTEDETESVTKLTDKELSDRIDSTLIQLATISRAMYNTAAMERTVKYVRDCAKWADELAVLVAEAHRRAELEYAACKLALLALDISQPGHLRVSNHIATLMSTVKDDVERYARMLKW